MIIRPEQSDDFEAIHDLTAIAFAPMPFGDGTEADSIDRMRDAGDLLLSLVAEEDKIIGHIAFSPLKTESPGRWAGLGPISVTPERQRKGIGSEMARVGLQKLKDLGFDGCALLGNPKVYGPMGFVSGDITYRDLPTEIVQWQSFTGLKPSGEILFCPGLE